MGFRQRIGLFAVVAFLATSPVLGAATLHSTTATISAADHAARPGHGPIALSLLAMLGMAIRVKDAATVARKWVTRASGASGDYAAGVKEAGADWEQNTLAGKENYSMGVGQAIADGRYEKGVREAGQGKYVTRASGIGSQRFAPGVQASEGEMARGVAPVLEAIRSINLPPRRPKGDPGNMERANMVASVLRKLKTGR